MCMRESPWGVFSYRRYDAGLVRLPAFRSNGSWSWSFVQANLPYVSRAKQMPISEGEPYQSYMALGRVHRCRRTGNEGRWAWKSFTERLHEVCLNQRYVCRFQQYSVDLNNAAGSYFIGQRAV